MPVRPSTNIRSQYSSREENVQKQIVTLKLKLKSSQRRLKYAKKKQPEENVQKQIVTLKLKLKSSQRRLKYAKKKQPTYRKNAYNIPTFVKFISPQSKALAEMQFLTKPKKAWTKTQKQFALALYYKSPSAYKFLRKQKIILPSVSTIRRWIGESDLLPGLNNKYLSLLKLKVSTMEEAEKQCIIMFDEMKLKSLLEYSKYLDIIEGFEDYGKEFGRTKNVGTDALVFLLRGIHEPWKFPLCYFISNSSSNKFRLKNILLAAIEETMNIGLVPKVVVCDQASTNCSNRRNYEYWISPKGSSV
ncbi:Transposase protein [Popillia japonica]|uniref:Transposase protein n=1 Tax=Popillia japonica TaxID=7064 RepID=A0AAW1HFM0_POPJA